MQDRPTNRSATTICLINQKGGCGKSSTCFHLSGSLARAGYRVLLVDADPQGSLGQAFGGSAEVENLAPEQTLAAAFAELPSTLAIVRTDIENVDIVRANQSLAKFNQPEPEFVGLRQWAIAEALAEVDSDYDFVLIDCPPNLYLCTWASLLAACWVLVPVPPEDFGTQGLRAVHAAIENAKLLNPGLRLLGHLVTRVDKRLVVHRHYEQMLRTIYEERVLQTTVPELAAFKVALACRQPVVNYSPRCKAARSMASLVEELETRISTSACKKQVA